jgi:hypothetical protein
MLHLDFLAQESIREWGSVCDEYHGLGGRWRGRRVRHIGCCRTDSNTGGAFAILKELAFCRTLFSIHPLLEE